jgi:acetyl-CoA carboxylase carboxyl transferase subunit beta
VVDGVLPEPSQVEAANALEMATALGDAVSWTLAELEQTENVDLVRDRRARFRGFGARGTLVMERGREAVR